MSENQSVKLAGYFLFIGLIAAAIWLGGDLDNFVDYPSLTIVVGCGFSISVLCGAVFTRQSCDRERLVQWRSIAVSIVIATMTGVMIGLIRMFSYLTIPSVIGPSIAIVLLSCFAGLLILSLAALPRMDRYTKACGAYREASLARIACFGFPLMCVFVVVLSLIILIASMGYMK